MNVSTTERRFGVGDLLGALVALTVAYALLGRFLFQSGRIAQSTYHVGLTITLLCEAVVLVAVVVVFR